jgi:hypothetical protein
MSNLQKFMYNRYYYFFLKKNLKFLFFDYFTIYFAILIDASNFLNLIFQKKKFMQEKKLESSFENVLVLESLVKKKENIEISKFLDISEFVFSKQKEIYLNNYTSFFLKNNLILQKKFIIEKFYFVKLNRLFHTYFMKVKSLGNVFFVQYRIYGLGFKIKKSSLMHGRFLRFDLGFGHGIYYRLPLQIKCLKRKRRFLFYSTDFHCLVFLKKHIDSFKLLNPYKIRGLKDLKDEKKMKKGKKQSKK